MRKSMTRVLLLALILALLCVGALAAGDKDTTNVTEITNGYAVTPLKGNGDPADQENGVYVDVAKFELTYTATNEGEQLVMLLLNGTTPTKDNIYYIDQQSSAGGQCSFTIYPKQLTTGTYRLMVASKTSETAATIVYDAAYILGDVDGNQNVDSSDAVVILKSTVNLVTLSAQQKIIADVDKSGNADSSDAVWILKKTVNLIKDFSEIPQR